ncbi:MAG TPA: hypothetical protein VFG65_03935 [Fimbriimonadales bacterium]|jgi:hypothetical protein|nr:hypothetical protein [Fimbriimonadales bacterium]
MVKETVASALAGMPNLRIIRRPYDPEDDISFANSPAPAEDAEIVEGDSLSAFQVPAADESRFTHFTDGVQKSRPAFFDGQLPGYFAALGASIMRRVDRMLLESTNYVSLSAIVAPAESETLPRLAHAGFEVRPTEAEAGSGMSGLAEAVKTKISTLRNEMEDRIRVDWLRMNSDGWLLADGGIASSAAAVLENRKIVGVVKSHNKQYFASRQAADVVLNLRAGERSSVFVARRGSLGRDVVYSWYLRLVEDMNESPAFGLVRVELPFVDESIGSADEVSGWLLAERAPLSLPDRRYDRMLYPIRCVEQYLKALLPSDSAMSAIVGAI